MVFLRPRVTRTPEEARLLLEEADRRAPLVKKWREDLPLGLDGDKTKPNGDKK
jgi:type II secretory pathway component GspD/PulD (secretin)